MDSFKTSDLLVGLPPMCLQLSDFDTRKYSAKEIFREGRICRAVKYKRSAPQEIAVLIFGRFESHTIASLEARLEQLS